MKLCAPLMCVPCSLMYRLMKQFKFVSISSTLSLNLQDYHDQHFMCYFEEQWVNNTVTCPSIWFRYVDDTFSLFDNKDKASSFLHYLNNRHPNIKFTMELGENQEIPFLDVLIKRHQNAFSTTVHRKKTFTGLYTKWDSFTPRKYFHKIDSVNTRFSDTMNLIAITHNND